MADQEVGKLTASVEFDTKPLERSIDAMRKDLATLNSSFNSVSKGIDKGTKSNEEAFKTLATATRQSSQVTQQMVNALGKILTSLKGLDKSLTKINNTLVGGFRQSMHQARSSSEVFKESLRAVEAQAKATSKAVGKVKGVNAPSVGTVTVTKMPIVETRNYNAELKNIQASLEGIRNATEKNALSLGSAFTRASFVAYQYWRALDNIKNVFDTIAGDGMRFAMSLETNQVGMSGILSSMVTLNGKNLEWNQAMEMSKDIMKDLNVEAARTSATSEELIETFRALLGPGLGSGMSIDEIKKFTTVGVNAVKSMGLEGRQLVQELRDLVQGGIQAASSTLATALGLKDADIKRARESSEGLFKFLMKRLEGFRNSADATGATLSGMIAQVSEAYTLATASALEPLIVQIKSDILSLKDILFSDDFSINPEFVKSLQEVYLWVKDVYVQVKETAVAFYEWASNSSVVMLLVGTIKTLGENLKLVLGLMSAFYAVQQFSAIIGAWDNYKNTIKEAIKAVEQEIRIKEWSAQISEKRKQKLQEEGKWEEYLAEQVKKTTRALEIQNEAKESDTVKSIESSAKAEALKKSFNALTSATTALGIALQLSTDDAESWQSTLGQSLTSAGIFASAAGSIIGNIDEIKKAFVGLRSAAMLAWTSFAPFIPFLATGAVAGLAVGGLTTGLYALKEDLSSEEIYSRYFGKGESQKDRDKRIREGYGVTDYIGAYSGEPEEILFDKGKENLVLKYPKPSNGEGASGSGKDATKDLYKLIDSKLKVSQAELSAEMKKVEEAFKDNRISIQDYVDNYFGLKTSQIDEQIAVLKKKMEIAKQYGKDTDYERFKDQIAEKEANKAKIQQEALIKQNSEYKKLDKLLQSIRKDYGDIFGVTEELNEELLNQKYGDNLKKLTVELASAWTQLQKAIKSGDNVVEESARKRYEEVNKAIRQTERLEEAERRAHATKKAQLSVELAGLKSLREEREASLKYELGYSDELDKDMAVWNAKRKNLDEYTRAYTNLIEKLKEERNLLDVSSNDGTEKYISLTNQINEAITALQKLQQEMHPILKKMKDSFQSNLGNMFDEIIDGTKSASEALKDFGKNFLKDIQKQWMQKMANDMTNNLFGFINQSVNGVPSVSGILGIGTSPQDTLNTSFNTLTTTLTNTVTPALTNFANNLNSMRGSTKELSSSMSVASEDTSANSDALKVSALQALPGFTMALATATGSEGLMKFSMVLQSLMSILSMVGSAGIIKGLPFAEGGHVVGAGTGTSDSIPARLSNGEFVVKASAVKRVGVDYLNALNGGKMPSARLPRFKFADGGYVDVNRQNSTTPFATTDVDRSSQTTINFSPIFQSLDPEANMKAFEQQYPIFERKLMNAMRNSSAMRGAIRGAAK